MRQSKVRTRPIAITDIAIEKVSRVEFDGFNHDENEEIRKCHQLLLRRARGLSLEKQDNEYEYAIMLNLHTWEWIEIEGGKGIVRPYRVKEAKYALENGTINSILYMHNHPSTGTFSAVDIKTFLFHEAIFIMTAVGNDGYVYSIQKTKEIDVNGFIMEYLKLAGWFKKNGYKNEATMAINELLKKARNYGLIYKKGGR